MKREAPTDREIAELIAPAFDRLPEPDARRLMAIEQRLLEETRSCGRTKYAWWWLVGALVAGAASALWWAVDYDSGEGQEGPVPGVISPPAMPPAPEPSAPPSRSEGTESKPAGEPAPKQGPVIYRKGH